MNNIYEPQQHFYVLDKYKIRSLMFRRDSDNKLYRSYYYYDKREKVLHQECYVYGAEGDSWEIVFDDFFDMLDRAMSKILGFNAKLL